ncbi:hypothetical protein, partial [Brevundimonas sp.]|uniref:hypothetical protein n=1 Tax=Brevundimonas sp. TaxID=1871086 RepID=UPI0025C48CF1
SNEAPTDALRLVPGKRLRPDARVLPGDVLRAVETFTNPDLLTKGDVVIVQSQGDDGSIVAFNLFRNVAQYGFNPTRYAFVHRPATRMKADYSHMLAAAPASPLPGGGWQDISTAPRTGEEFQAWWKGTWQPRARFDPEYGSFQLWGRTDFDTEGWEVFEIDGYWQPQPAAPTGEPK